MKLLQTKEYLCLIDKEAKIKKGDLVAPRGLASYKVKSFDPLFDSSSFHYKVIAYFPLTKDSKELDLPLLPNPYNTLEAKKFKDAQEYALSKNQTNIGCLTKTKVAWLDGYEAAGQFNLEDIKKAFEAGWQCKVNNGYKSDGTYYEDESKLIQSLSTQQLPKEFIPQYKKQCSRYDYTWCHDAHSYGYDGDSCDHCINQLVVAEHEKGINQLMGTYKY